MCGIVGFIIDNDALPLDITICQMISSLRHRGPDDHGCWIDRNAGVVLGHTHLSVLDLSPQGHQPMHSAYGRYVIVFNGEIYNFQEIRRELEDNSGDLPISWRGSSDTEVMLAAFSRWGVETSLKRFVGMFAFALWDRQDRVLYLVRDRVGEKPLYYGWSGGTFLFGSELKALRAHPNFRAEINRDTISLLLRHNYIPAPYSIYQGINKLLPGSFLKVILSSLADKCSFTPIPHWSVRELAENGITNPFTGSADEAANILNNLLLNAVRDQMVADVPLGAFLSGGVDLSSIVALMQAVSSRPVRSFTIGFHEKGYNEALHAKAVAQHIGTDHTELYINPSDALSVIPNLPSLYDEPFSDSSQIPTYLISQLTRRHVTVSLSGDAGDELFGGYNRYFWADDIWRKIGWMPKQPRTMISRLLKSFSPQAWDFLFNHFRPVIPKRFRERRVGDQIHRLAEIIRVQQPFDMYRGLVSHWKEPTDVALHTSEPLTALTDISR